MKTLEQQLLDSLVNNTIQSNMKNRALLMESYNEYDEYDEEEEEETEEALGDCYQAAGQYAMMKCQFSSSSTECDDLVIVHGEVMGQGHLEGITYGHAWIESKGMVIDVSNGRNIKLPISTYYLLGKIGEIDNYVKYTWKEAREKIIASKHWGPWDLETSSGL